MNTKLRRIFQKLSNVRGHLKNHYRRETFGSSNGMRDRSFPGISPAAESWGTTDERTAYLSRVPSSVFVVHLVAIMLMPLRW